MNGLLERNAPIFCPILFFLVAAKGALTRCLVFSLPLWSWRRKFAVSSHFICGYFANTEYEGKTGKDEDGSVYREAYTYFMGRPFLFRRLPSHSH